MKMLFVAGCVLALMSGILFISGCGLTPGQLDALHALEERVQSYDAEVAKIYQKMEARELTPGDGFVLLQKLHEGRDADKAAWKELKAQQVPWYFALLAGALGSGGLIGTIFGSKAAKAIRVAKVLIHAIEDISPKAKSAIIVRAEKAGVGDALDSLVGAEGLKKGTPKPVPMPG